MGKPTSYKEYPPFQFPWWPLEGCRVGPMSAPTKVVEGPEKEEIGGIGGFGCQSGKAAGVKAIAEQETHQ